MGFLGLSNEEALDNVGRDATIEIIDVTNYQELPPPPCRTYTITTTTDNYQHDNVWSIIEKGGIGVRVAISPKFPTAATTYDEQLCVPYDTCYTYTITDTYGDGICCKQGRGGFKIEDVNSEPPEYVLGGGIYFNDIRAVHEDGDVDLQKKKEILFCTGPNPNPPPPTLNPTPYPTKNPTPTPPPVWRGLEDDDDDNIVDNKNVIIVDDSEYLFQNKKGRNCKGWVDAKSKSRCAKIDKKYGNCDKRVSEFCPFTCSSNNETEDKNTNDNSGGGGGGDDTEGKFEHKGKKMDCKKVTKKKQCNKKYKGDDSDWKGKLLWQLCPVSCQC